MARAEVMRTVLWTYRRARMRGAPRVAAERGSALRTLRIPAWGGTRGFGEQAAAWVVLQQVVVRGLVAAKFLAVGRILGPAAIGSVSVALLAVAIAEALSDTGLAQAVIQGREAPNRPQLGAVWTTLAARGVLVALLLVALAPLLARAFHIGAALMLVQLAALLPLLRGIASPAYFVVQRERHFRHIAGVEIAAAALDCCVGLALELGGAGAVSLLAGMAAGETLKTALTWLTMQPRPPLRLRWSGIGHYLGFSRWIWAGSVVTLVLNQFDKVVVARMLGPVPLGAWQMSSKLAQMLLADAALALSQYLFPTFAAHHRDDAHAARRLFLRWLAVAAVLLAALVAVLRMAAAPLFALVLGSAWLGAVPLFRIFVINMAIGALIAMLVAYLRATGDAKAAAHASVFQVLVLVAAVPLGARAWGVTGVAWAMTAGLAASAAWMLARIVRAPAARADGGAVPAVPASARPDEAPVRREGETHDDHVESRRSVLQ